MFRSMIVAGLAALLSNAAQAQPGVAIAVSGPGWSLAVAPPPVLMVAPVRVVPGWVVHGNGGTAPAPRWSAPPYWHHVHHHAPRRDWRDARGEWRRDEDRGRGGRRSRWDH